MAKENLFLHKYTTFKQNFLSYADQEYSNMTEKLTFELLLLSTMFFLSFISRMRKERSEGIRPRGVSDGRRTAWL